MASTAAWRWLATFTPWPPSPTQVEQLGRALSFYAHAFSWCCHASRFHKARWLQPLHHVTSLNVFLPPRRPPPSDWPSGTIRQFYMYHQLGDGGMYTLKTRAALSGGVEEFVVTQVGVGGWVGPPA